MVSLVVPNNQLSSAFGLVQSFQNLGLAIISILTGLIVQNYGYFVLELFFLTLCLIGLLTASLLYFVDQARGKIY